MKPNHRPCDILKAIGNQYRYKIILALLTGEKNVAALNRVIRVSQPALSQHLKKLRTHGVVDSRRDARKIYYFINDARVVRVIGIFGE